MAEKIKTFCPTCKEEKEFVRVVETHIETERFTSHTIIGQPLARWSQKTEFPLAYCSSCKTVLYVGPSPEEVLGKLR